MQSQEQGPLSAGTAERYALVRTATPGVYRRGSRFVVVWRHRGRQHKQSCLSYTEAIALRDRRRAGDTRPDWRPHRKDSFRRYARLWVDEYRGRTHKGLDESTREDYRLSLEAWAIPALGQLRISDVIPRDIRQLVLRMEQRGLRPSTIRKHLAPVKLLFATAYEDLVVDRDPTLTIRVAEYRPDIQSQPPRRKALTHEELARLLDALEPRYRLVVEFVVHTGLRCSEVAGLCWEHVVLAPPATVSVRQQFRNGRLKPPKTPHSVRTIPLAPGMAARLLTHRLNAAATASDLVFPTATGRPLDAHNFATRVLRPAARQAGLQAAGFHQLRHTCAALLIESGKDLKQVQEWLGHCSPRVTMQHYLHLMDRGLGDADFMDLHTGRRLFGNELATTTGMVVARQ